MEDRGVRSRSLWQGVRLEEVHDLVRGPRRGTACKNCPHGCPGPVPLSTMRVSSIDCCCTQKGSVGSACPAMAGKGRGTEMCSELHGRPAHSATAASFWLRRA